MTKAAEWHTHVSEQSKSGESIAAYCRRVGIKEHAFKYWRHRQAGGGAAARFISLSGSDDEAELHLPSGVIIKARICNLPKVLEAINASACA